MSTVAVEAAKAALCEAGHPELAALVKPNRAGVPKIEDADAHRDHRSVIARAFMLGHLAAGHDAHMSRSIDADFQWVDCIRCSCADDADDIGGHVLSGGGDNE